jgi:hypothetical protein
MSQYFDIYDDGTGIYSLTVIQQVNTNLKNGLIAYEKPANFSLVGSDGKTYNFVNNVSWNSYNPSSPVTPQPKPPPKPSPKPNNNNDNTSGNSSGYDSFFLIGGVAGILIYYKYKLNK